MSIEVDVVSGFLGAGKTTMIRKLLDCGVLGENVIIIENEYGDITIDSGRLDKAGIEIRSMEAGCICCSLSGDFEKALQDLIESRKPDQVVIEPTGVGMLSDILNVIASFEKSGKLRLNTAMTIVDVLDFEDFIEVFGDFYKDQICSAQVIVLSKTQLAEEAAVQEVIEAVRALNPEAALIAVPWNELSKELIFEATEIGRIMGKCVQEFQRAGLSVKEGNRGHDQVHDHSTDQTGKDNLEHDLDKQHFDVWSRETMKPFNEEELKKILMQLSDPRYGQIIRVKGTLSADDGTWLDFDRTPSHSEVIPGKPRPVGQMAVIGLNLDQAALYELFGLWPVRS